MSRRSVVVAASSGLIMSVIAAPATATVPAENTTSHAAVDTSNLTAGARAALATSPVVAVPDDASWSLDIPPLTVVADPPPPPVRAAPPAASRSAARAAVPAEAAPAAAIGAAAPASANGSAIVEIASRYVGVSYLWGGTTPAGFDCSGYTSYVYAQVGITLPRTSSAQREVGTVVSRADAQPGDLIWSPGHIAIYAGGDLQVDAPRPGQTIQIRSIWQSNPTFIRVS
ncbi:C40 family peptidase [Pengzhenrongella frigida]|uniref:C40 family peptidase n=1 Tax=Pengzhenrongella frigida TaxID=1259133 RepID=UPI003313030E